jgi:WD40 repeat protein
MVKPWQPIDRMALFWCGICKPALLISAQTMMRQCGLCVSILRDKFTRGGSHDQTVRLWDVQTHQCLRVLRGHKDAVRAIAFDADDQRLASGNCDRTTRLWDVQIGEGLRVLPAHTGGIFTLVRLSHQCVEGLLAYNRPGTWPVDENSNASTSGCETPNSAFLSLKVPA